MSDTKYVNGTIPARVNDPVIAVKQLSDLRIKKVVFWCQRASFRMSAE